jgi:hypothetical protein
MILRTSSTDSVDRLVSGAFLWAVCSGCAFVGLGWTEAEAEEGSGMEGGLDKGLEEAVVR